MAKATLQPEPDSGKTFSVQLFKNLISVFNDHCLSVMICDVLAARENCSLIEIEQHEFYTQVLNMLTVEYQLRGLD